MAYIGKQPVVGNFQVCDAISVVNGQAAYTMQVGSANVEPENANHMLVSLNGVLQKPGSSFTISGSTITFASNLVTNDVIDFIILLGDTLNVGTPSDDSVGAAQVKNDLISGLTALTSAPADTDEFLISDAGTLKRIDASLISGSNTPAFAVKKNANQTGLSDNTATKVTWQTEIFDTDSAFASDKFTVPSGEGGKYFINANVFGDKSSDINYVITYIYKNGSAVFANRMNFASNEDQLTAPISVIMDLSASDYLEVYFNINTGSGNTGTITANDGAQTDAVITIFQGFKLI